MSAAARPTADMWRHPGYSAAAESLPPSQEEVKQGGHRLGGMSQKVGPDDLQDGGQVSIPVMAADEGLGSPCVPSTCCGPVCRTAEEGPAGHTWLRG